MVIFIILQYSMPAQAHFKDFQSRCFYTYCKQIKMALSFPFGIKNCWDDTSLMQPRGLYWVNTDTEPAAYELCGQVVDAQRPDVIISVIYQKDNPTSLPCTSTLPPEHALIVRLLSAEDKTHYYHQAAGKKALTGLPVDISRLPQIKNQLLIFMLTAAAGNDLAPNDFNQWLLEIASQCARQNCAMLILCYGKGIHALIPRLYVQNRVLYGLAMLNSAHYPPQYVMSWWHNQFGVEANTAYALQPRSPGWEIAASPASAQHINNHSDDQWMYLAENSILEGAPPLSDKWFIFADNQHLVDRGLRARAATLIFALSANDQIETLARQIHLLRIRRGNALKIVVREMYPALRYIDQRLLQACGANLIVPHAARLSSFLTLLDDIQQGTFNRYVPENIELLLQGRLPDRHKGFLPLPVFCEVMQSILGQPTLAVETRGVLLALRPVGGISPQQAMSLCHLRRDGDVLTLTDSHLYLFLSNCQTSDVDSVLNFLFSLPAADMFQNRTLWYQDNAIQAEVRRLSGLAVPPEPPPAAAEPTRDAPPGKRRRLPVPLIVQLDGKPLPPSFSPPRNNKGYGQ
ncbi:cellulose biosynthesis protein BcsE [Sodalis sp. RH24]|uniref:cellulose biosynthesis protein BcsE n=2 Tax=unclassified Sodalis (in: enterobacteria) TaxID=2636512 RepID=UPI0039B49214